MAQIPRAALDYLTKEINGISADAKAKVMRVLEKLDWNDVPACRDAVVSAVNAVLDAYSLAAGQASADFFDASREIAVGSRLGAAVATGRDPDATEGAIRAFVDKVLKGDIDSFNRAVLSRVGYELKRSAGQTMMENAARDPLKPRFARVPGGGETCKFCLMLASRGFVYHTEKAASSFDHYHDNCDCQIVSSWDDDGAEGYDPDAIADRWNDLEWADAELRAERNGTTAEEEYAKRMRQLGESAKRAKRRRKNIGSDVPAARAAKAGASSGVSKKIIEDGAFSKRSFMSRGDPAKEYFGSAEESNPDELRELIAHLESEGVELRRKQREAIAYSPSPIPGLPGQMMYTDGMSWSAWQHENDHYERDKELGFPGLSHYLGDVALWDEMEERAYGIEIDYATRHGYNELADRLRILLDEDKKARRS